MDDLVQLNTILHERVHDLHTLVETQAKQLEHHRAESLRQAETLACLTEMMEDTMPIDVGHELVASVRAEAAEAGRSAMTRIEKVEQQIPAPVTAVREPIPQAGASSSIEQPGSMLPEYAHAVDGAAKGIAELSKRVSELESKHHSAIEIVSRDIKHRVVALESSMSRASAEAARRAEQSCQKLVTTGSVKADAACCRLSLRIDRLAEELAMACANITKHSAEAEHTASDLDERAEDCSALLQSSVEVNGRLSQLEEKFSKVNARQERDTTETRQELQEVHHKLAQRSVSIP